MTMQINIEQYEAFAAKNKLRQGEWGDLRHTACLMSALAGGTNIEKCEAAGWPRWLVEIGVWLFDGAIGIDAAIADGREFALAVKVAENRSADFEAIYKSVRMNAILPIAMESIGVGDEAWRVQCRAVVQDAIDCAGASSTPARAAGAAEAAWAAEAAGAAGAAARARIQSALINALRGFA